MADDCRVSCALGAEASAKAASRRDFMTQIAGVAVAALAGGDAASAAPFYPVIEMSGVERAPNQKSYPLPAADGVSIDKKSQVILVRFQGKVIAFNLACPHENTALRWKQGNGRFECPKHNSRYSPDGKFIDGRATRNMDRLPITRDGGNVTVDLSKFFKSDAQPNEWAAAVITV